MEPFQNNFRGHQTNILATSPKIRYRLGSTTAFLGLLNASISLAVGITGISFYFNYSDLFKLGNPGAGPGIIYMLILEGFVLEFFPALAVAFLGLCIRWLLEPTMKRLKRVKTNFNMKTQKSNKSIVTPMASTGPQGGKKGSTMWSKFRKSEPEQKSQVNQKGSKDGEDEEILSEEADDYEQFSKFKSMMESYAAKSPQFLWISLLLMAGTNVAMALTCYVMAGGRGAAGMAEAMRNYGTEQAARRAVDWVQSNGECCGDYRYTEWLSIKWCTEKTERPPTENLRDSVNMCADTHKSVKYDVPPSCCTPPRGPCIHDALDLLGLGPLHTDGCGGYINDLLDPKYIALMWFHAFFCFPKLMLVVLVLCLRPFDISPPEKATDEEASNLLPPEDSPPARPLIPPRRPNLPRPKTNLPRPKRDIQRNETNLQRPEINLSRPETNLPSTSSLVSNETTKAESGRNIATPPIYAAVSHPRVPRVNSAINPEEIWQVVERRRKSSPARLEPSHQETRTLPIREGQSQ